MSNLPLTVPDLVCVSDLDAFGAETSSDLETLEQDVFHILVEAAASNLDDLDRGLAIGKVLSGSTGLLASVAQHIDAELRKDDRIDSSTSSLTQLAPGAVLPDGTTVGAAGAWLLEIDIVAGGAVLGLSYSYTPAGGLLSQ